MILQDIKKMLDIADTNTDFDTDVTIHINTAFMVLNQVGLGPEKPFVILTGNETWEEFSADINNFEAIKSWMYLFVRKVFDNPGTSFVNDSDKAVLAELIWRLQLVGGE